MNAHNHKLFPLFCPKPSENLDLAIVAARADTKGMPTGSGPVPRETSEYPADEGATVIPFRPRNAPAQTPRRTPSMSAPEDLAKYERSAFEDDYRHRMLMNVAGLIVTILLATAGAWLAVTIADMRKNQDCYLSGRRNCTPIDVQSLPNR